MARVQRGVLLEEEAMIGVGVFDDVHQTLLDVGPQQPLPVGDAAVEIEGEVLHALVVVVVDPSEHLEVWAEIDGGASGKVVARRREGGNEGRGEGVGEVSVVREDGEVAVVAVAPEGEGEGADDRVLVVVLLHLVADHHTAVLRRPEVVQRLVGHALLHRHHEVLDVEDGIQMQMIILAVGERVHQNGLVLRHVRVAHRVEVTARAVVEYGQFLESACQIVAKSLCRCRFGDEVLASNIELLLVPGTEFKDHALLEDAFGWLFNHRRVLCWLFNHDSTFGWILNHNSILGWILNHNSILSWILNNISILGWLLNHHTICLRLRRSCNAGKSRLLSS